VTTPHMKYVSDQGKLQNWIFSLVSVHSDSTIYVAKKAASHNKS